ncbi:carbohydrate ABC transporter permease [Spirochaeta cellobiosiphila]|uniref:carbohydrate ABC transporter permease n=1 Tax=Spirochaeta cellobiosiphila TaxID=504483 RepID=UPI0003FAEBB8|nr:sugar ABC transporter permease [Spirochaeta cellobiosiphila]
MHKKRAGLLPYLLVAPTLVFVAVFTIYPTIASVIGSFYHHRLNILKYRTPRFYGLGNYHELFSSADFQQIIVNTLVYTIILVPLTIVVSFLFALWLRPKKFAPFRIAIFHPTILPAVSAATIWLFFFTPGYGLFNSFLSSLGYGGPQNWSSNPQLALFSLVIVAFWKDAGFYMIYFLAGLQNLPKDVYEALRLEGAHPFVVFFKFTLPLMRRTTLFVSTIAMVGAFRMVDHVIVITSGGPSNKSSLLLYDLWQERFENLNVGKSSAITVILILFLLVFTISNLLFNERKGVIHD